MNKCKHNYNNVNWVWAVNITMLIIIKQGDHNIFNLKHRLAMVAVLDMNCYAVNLSCLLKNAYFFMLMLNIPIHK